MSINQWVLTKQEIKALSPDDGDEIGVFENTSIYSYSATSTEVDDNDIYIAPTSQSGRWIKTKSYSAVNHVHATMYTQAAIDGKIVLLEALSHNHDTLYRTITEIQAKLRDTVPLSVLPNFEINMPATPRVAYLQSMAAADFVPANHPNPCIWVEKDGTTITPWFWDGTNNKKIKLT